MRFARWVASRKRINSYKSYWVRSKYSIRMCEIMWVRAQMLATRLLSWTSPLTVINGACCRQQGLLWHHVAHRQAFSVVPSNIYASTLIKCNYSGTLRLAGGISDWSIFLLILLGQMCGKSAKNILCFCTELQFLFNTLNSRNTMKIIIHSI